MNYDVISAEAQRRYHAQSPYNIINLEFGMEQPMDSTESNKYNRAAKTLESWLQDSILVKEQHTTQGAE